MIRVDPDHIPRILIEEHGPDDFRLIYDKHTLIDGLPEYLARLFMGAPVMLEFLSRMAKRPTSPARLPIEAMLQGIGIELKWKEQDDER